MLRPSLALATEAPSVALGKLLLHSTHLGSSAGSCASCHPAGESLQKLADREDDSLKRQINACISRAFKGGPLDAHSTKMELILRYLRSLSPATN